MDWHEFVRKVKVLEEQGRKEAEPQQTSKPKKVAMAAAKH